MKIISKYKDYYDYLVGQRGIDNKIVLDRREGIVLKGYDISKSSLVLVHICGITYTGYTNSRGITYWAKNLSKCGKKIKSFFRGTIEYEIILRDGAKIVINPTPVKTELNDKYNCSILISIGYSKVEKYPRLKDFNVGSFYPSEKIYNDLYNWISKRIEPNIKDNRTNIEKIKSAGFDVVHSFRNTK